MYTKPLRSLVFAAGTLSLLLAVLMAAGHQPVVAQATDWLAACDVSAHAWQVPADDAPGKGPDKLASKPCKRVGQLIRNLEKPVLILAIATAPAPLPPEIRVQRWSLPAAIPVSSLFLRRSGITRAPPALA